MAFPKVSTYFLALFFLLSVSASAQKETVNWYFGDYAGLTFPGRTVGYNLLLNGKLKAAEGCATISDSLGNLLFYTAGDTVFNKNHQKMNNGWLLLGDSSSSQSSIIIQQPGNLSQYYLFTTDARGEPNGLRYSVINTAALQGQGSVLAKNIPLLTPVAEKITAVDHRLTRDIWIVAHGSSAQNDAFYAYLLTKTGLQPPVISQIGASHQRTAAAGPNLTTIGCMKISPDGSKLALAIQNKNLVQVFSFNDITGVVSDSLSLSQIPQPYGIEFSPDSKKLYISSENSTADIYQVNLAAGAGQRDSVMASRRFIGTNTNPFAGTLQQAYNGVIYIANSADSTLSVIEFPDDLLNPEMNPDAVSLGARVSKKVKRVSRQGLPNFNQSYFYKPYVKTKFYCFGDETTFSLADSLRFKAVTWNFGDPGSGAANISTEKNPKHRFTKEGKFTINLEATLLNNKTRSLTLNVTIYPLPKVALGADLEICPGDTIRLGGSEFGGTSVTGSFLWSTGETSDSINISQPGTYWLEAMSFNKCPQRDSIVIKFKQAPPFFAEPVTGLCAGTSATLKTILPEGTPLSWFNGSTERIVTVKKEGYYKLTAYTNGCYFTDSVQVAYQDCPEIFMVPNVITPNGDDLNETFLLRGVVPGTWEIQLYDRWGSLIFQSADYRNQWPEKNTPDGTYFYRLVNKNSGRQHRGWLQVMH